MLNGNTAHGDFNFELPVGPGLLDVPSCAEICEGGSVELFAFGFSGAAPYGFEWSNGSTGASISVSPAASTTYSVNITDANGCTATATIDVTVNGAPMISCSPENGACGALGSASVTASGGSNSYSYAWSNGASGAMVTDLASGSYTVTVTDTETGCSDECTVVIINTPAIVADCSSTDGECGALGSASVTASGGSGTYSYSWSNGETSASITDLASGSYTITVTDTETGCSKECTVVIDNTPALTVSCSDGGAVCDGGLTGTASATAGGGTGDYSYAWDNGATTASISGLAAGTYTVTVTDGAGCSASCSVTVGTFPQPMAAIDCADINLNTTISMVADSDPTCNNNPNYAFWSNNLLPGNKYWTVTDGLFDVFADGTASFTGTVTNVGNANWSFTVDAVFSGRTAAPPAGSPKSGNCVSDVSDVDWEYYTSTSGTLTGNGMLSGALVQISRFGEAFQIGTGAHLNNPAVFGASGWLDFDVLSQPTDGSVLNGNTAHGDFNFELPVGPGLLDVPSCAEICEGGSVELFAFGFSGAAPYGFEWSNGSTGASVSVSPAASTTYSVNVTDANGCTATATIDVTVNGAPMISCSPENGACGALGSASVTASGGSGTYSYSWSNGETSASITDLASGSYTVTVTDTETGCSDECTVVINNTPAIVADCSSTDGACGALGSASVNASDGSGTYSYSWSNGETSASITDLASGSYTVTVTDTETGCSDECTVVIDNTPPLTVSCSEGNAVCDGGLTGTASATAGDGSGDYSYAWSNGATTASISGLVAGTYTVTVTDGAGCSASCSVTVGTFPQPMAAIDCADINLNTTISMVADSDPTCNNNPNYAFWFNNLLPGNKYWTVTDGLFDVFADGTASFTGTVTNVGNANWSFTVDAVFSGRTAAPPAGSPKSGNCVSDVSDVDWEYYTSTSGTLTGNGMLSGALVQISRFGEAFQIGTGAHLNNPAVFGASGWLDFDVLSQPTDGPVLNGNTAHGDFNFELPVGPGLLDVPSCAEICEGGSVELFAFGFSGAAPYGFEWSNGSTGASISVSPAASTTYSVNITDANGCTATATIDVTVNGAPMISCSPENGACGALGSASVTASGGSGTYSYSWSNGETSASITDLASGSYTVTVTDTETGCSDECTVVINNTPAIVADCSSTDGECGALGSASVTASGGSNSYSYAWSNGASGAMVTDLASGSYTVTVTDTETGCSDECTVVIINTPAIVADCSSMNGACGALGSASVTASGGSGTYSYSWSNGETSASITDLASGSYTVTVTDTETGCSDDCTVVIDNTPALTVSCSEGNAVCDGGLTGTASATAGDGSGDYSYAWSNGATTASISGLVAGTYTVAVTDGAGCSASCSVTVGTFPQPMAAIDCADINLNTTISMVADSDPTCNNNPNYAFWSNNLLPGNKYWTVTDGLFDVFADGTASFTGTVTNVGNANWSFTVDAVFSGSDRCPSCRFAQVGQLCL